MYFVREYRCVIHQTHPLPLPLFPQLNPGRQENITVNGSVVDFQRVVECKEHAISSFLPGDLLLIFTYWFGLYLFSRGETEYLSNLADKVGRMGCCDFQFILFLFLFILNLFIYYLLHVFIFLNFFYYLYIIIIMIIK